MAADLAVGADSSIKFIVGDVRDAESVEEAFQGVDYVIHAAAMKHVHIAEANPEQCIKTNIDGAKNIIRAAINNKVQKVVALSTDKACSPVSLYGSTKLVSDKLFINASNKKQFHNVNFSVVRYGNIMGCRGTVIPSFFKNEKRWLSINYQSRNDKV